MPDLLKTNEVADKLRISERIVIQLIKNGELRGFKIGGRWRIFSESLDKYFSLSDSQPPPNRPH